MKKLDQLDFEILGLLQGDGRKSYTEMGNLLNVSEGTIRSRINKMLEDRIFEFIIHVDPNKIGLFVQAIIGIKTQLGFQEDVASKLQEFSAVRFIGAFSGRNDIILQAYFRSNDELVNFVNQELAKIEGIISADVSIELKQYKDSFSFVQSAGDGL
ncbi:transcriptional regulator [Ammoniphilus oxalaticus]|uniref:Transcriptional regulator n=1 Tax=Ammoniphilus oxalaticus TaxID=66863 RepID=A0A419SMX3_9BACL|nr:Lrp/AsnC family transcriptional regulator [Ammoniphilus oxalaticus]RKD25637.1 transcriptional regulator [Ammoniphilus oxalaticus]